MIPWVTVSHMLWIFPILIHFYRNWHQFISRWNCHYTEINNKPSYEGMFNIICIENIEVFRRAFNYVFLSLTLIYSPKTLVSSGVSSGSSLTSSRESASLALVGHPSSDGVTIKMLYGVDVLHWPASHPIFSYWVG